MVFIPTISPVFAMYVKMMLAMGVVFEMPTAVYFLARIGLVTAGFLISKFKYALLIIVIAAAILTPGTDVVSQALMAGPMIVLYIISIAIAWLFAKKKAPLDPDV
jgi:sec-independent protein translocase protein TatC